MKSTGIVRRVDDLGRVVLPMELRKTLEIEPRDALEIFLDGSTVALKKYAPQCAFCGESEDVIAFKSKNICQECAEEIAEVGREAKKDKENSF